MRQERSGAVAVLLGYMLLLGVLLPLKMAWAWSWQDLWQTPDQQQRALEEAGEFESLVESESSQWQGVGHYRSGDYAAAAESFAQTEDVGNLYNQATALTRAGEYDAAIEQYDQLLSLDPAHEKAAQNLEIAKQLKQLQQQNPQQNQDSDSQQGDNQDSEQQQDQSQQQDQQDQQEQQEQQDSADQQQDQQSQQQQQSDESSSQEQEQESQQQSEEQQQEQQQQQEQDAAQQQQQARQASAAETDEPLTENQQAIEQWLRKIPDDPTGLLRRKLMRSHATDYPGVGDSQSPW